MACYLLKLFNDMKNLLVCCSWWLASLLLIVSCTESPLYFWGSYCPDLLVAFRARSPHSPILHVFWSDSEGKHLRSVSKAEGVVFNWVYHDGVGSGCQEIRDNKLNCNVSSCFVTDTFQSLHHQVYIQPLNKVLSTKYYVYVSVMLEDTKPSARVNFFPALGRQTVTIEGDKPCTKWMFLYGVSSDPFINKFIIGVSFRVSFCNGTNESYVLSVASKRLLQKGRYDTVWDIPEFLDTQSQYINTGKYKERHLNNRIVDKAQMIMIQLALSEEVSYDNVIVGTHLFALPGSFTDKSKAPFFQPGFLESCGSSDKYKLCVQELNAWMGFKSQGSEAWLNSEIKRRREEFRKRQMELVGFPYRTEANSMLNFKEYVLSNFFGNYGYFNGDLMIKLPKSPIQSKDFLYLKSSRNLQLFTSTPCRDKFPHGFLWDEGFHLLLSRRWSMNLFSLSLSAWLDLQFDDENNNYLTQLSSKKNITQYFSGWIPREVLIGSLAKKRISENFLYQDMQVKFLFFIL